MASPTHRCALVKPNHLYFWFQTCFCKDLPRVHPRLSALGLSFKRQRGDRVSWKTMSGVLGVVSNSPLAFPSLLYSSLGDRGPDAQEGASSSSLSPAAVQLPVFGRVCEGWCGLLPECAGQWQLEHLSGRIPLWPCLLPFA